MKQVVSTAHLRLRLKVRAIPHELPQKIYQSSTERYFDTATKRFIAVKNVMYRGKRKEFALIYEDTPSAVFLISIHPLKTYQKSARIRRGRWQEL